MKTQNLDLAAAYLRNDELVAIPTETVYGLAGNAFKDEVVQKIYDLKKRPASNPLIVHIASVDFLPEIAQNIPEIAFELARTFWPGPLTLLLEKKAHISDLVTAGKKTVAVRVPDHPLTLKLLNQLDFPLVAPSANPFTSISPTCAEHVDRYFADALGLILDGGHCIKGIESTIIGFQENQPVLYRHGSLSMAEIEKITGELTIYTCNDQAPEAPGMFSRHYAPHTNTFLTDDVPAFLTLFSGQKIGILTFENKIQSPWVAHQEILSKTGDMAEASQNLYAAMHRLDSKNLDVIIAERLPDAGLGKTINDKLQRAAQKAILQ